MSRDYDGLSPDLTGFVYSPNNEANEDVTTGGRPTGFVYSPNNEANEDVTTSGRPKAPFPG